MLTNEASTTASEGAQVRVTDEGLNLDIHLEAGE